MQEIHLNLRPDQSLIEQLSKSLEGEMFLTTIEHQLKFNNSIGNGTIRQISFDWGISLLDYNVNFNEDVVITFNLEEINVLEFLFLIKGNLSYTSKALTEVDNLIKLNQYQNIVLSNLPDRSNTFVFHKGETIKLNVVQLFGSEYMNKPKNHIDTLQLSLQSIINGKKELLPYQHFGNYNLKLADIIETLNDNGDDNEGMIRFLNIEGQIYCILALHILEHKSFEKKLILPHSITNTDLIKVKEITQFINDNIQDVYTVSELAKIHSFSPKKMQTGFKLLYDKSVNTYIREKKLAFARDLIMNTDLTISEIVYQTGYRSRSYFSKIFFEYYDILPIAYRCLINSKSSISEKE